MICEHSGPSDVPREALLLSFGEVNLSNLRRMRRALTSAKIWRIQKTSKIHWPAGCKLQRGLFWLGLKCFEHALKTNTF